MLSKIFLFLYFLLAAAKFSPPSINISMANGNVWVTVHFPCSPSVSCFNDGEDYEEEEGMGCSCPLTEFKSLQATVTLYNKQNLLETKVLYSLHPFNPMFNLCFVCL